LFTNNDYHSNRWTATGDFDTGIAAGSSFHIEFTLSSANTYNLVLSPVAGGAALFTKAGASLVGTVGASITTIRISDYGTGSSADGSKEYFFDDLMITAPSTPGDYNNNGTVDAADYVSWRATFDQIVPPTSGADGNNNGRIDAGDYDVWRADFARLAGAGTILSQPDRLALAIPEPTDVVLVFAVFLVMIPWRIASRSSPILARCVFSKERSKHLPHYCGSHNRNQHRRDSGWAANQVFGDRLTVSLIPPLMAGFFMRWRLICSTAQHEGR
jgi:hypothetical protein